MAAVKAAERELSRLHMQDLEGMSKNLTQVFAWEQGGWRSGRRSLSGNLTLHPDASGVVRAFGLMAK